MTLHRFFVDAPVPDGGGVVALSAEDVHHLKDVLRLMPGDEIVAVAGGEAARVRLTHVGATVEGVPLCEVQAGASPAVTLVQGLAKGEKMDAVVRQATEIGVSRVVPLAAERSVVRLDERRAAARLDRWRRIASEAAKQSQRAEVPEITPVSRIEELPAVLGGARVAVCWEDAEDAPGIHAAIGGATPGPGPVVTPVAVVVGPEGGLTAEEVRALQRIGAVVVSLGPTVLRTETAGVVAAALAMHACGGLGGPGG